MYDVIVIGGGPAGLSTALALGRTMRSTLVLDSGEPRNAPAEHMHNFITRDGTPPADFLAVARNQLARYDTVEIREGEAVNATRLPDGGFEITLADGETARSRRIVLATGVVDETLPIEGMPELWGRGIFHCPYCHGYEVRGKSLAVLGASPAAVNLAVHLTRLSDDVVLLTNGPADIDESTTRILRDAGVPVREELVTRVEGRDGHLERVIFANGEEIERHAVFAHAAMRQRSDLPGQLGCAMLPDDAVEIDELGRTSVPGVYAAGDMARRGNGGRMSSVITAAAAGTIAGAAADKDLLAEEFGLPSPGMAPARST